MAFNHTGTRIVTLEELVEGRETVTMIFPHRVLLSMQDGNKVEFPAGTHEVPVSLKDHQYLLDNGVHEYQTKAEVPTTQHPNGLMTPELEMFMVDCGKTDPAEHQKLLDEVSKDQAPGFFGSFNSWKAKKASTASQTVSNPATVDAGGPKDSAASATAINPEHDAPASEDLKKNEQA